MRKSKSFKYAFALFGILWTGVAVLLISLFLPDIIQDYMIVNNGEAIDAVVTGGYEDTSYSENGKHYWYMTYQYSYDGREYEGKTSSAYDENELLKKGSTIKILYYQGNSVQEDYTLDNSSIFIGVFVVISLGVGIGMGIAAIKSNKKDRTMDKLKAHGTRTKATFVSSYSNLSVNNVSYYTIKYTFKDGYGIERTEESLGHCLRSEAEYLEALTEFEIAYADGKSVIVEDLENRKSLDEILNNVESVEPIDTNNEGVSDILPNTNYECPSCGAVSKPTESGACQYCGTQINNN